jgi:hypothetical protein
VPVTLPPFASHLQMTLEALRAGDVAHRADADVSDGLLFSRTEELGVATRLMAYWSSASPSAIVANVDEQTAALMTFLPEQGTGGAMIMA